jgi:UDP-glucose 4-epimerase
VVSSGGGKTRRSSSSARPSRGRAPARSNGAPAPVETSTVIVTGIAGRLGRVLARRLHRSARSVIGIDRRPLEWLPKDMVHHRIDIRSKRCRDVFRQPGVEAVIHLGIMHDPRMSYEEHLTWNVMGTQKVLDYCVDFKIPKVVVLSSANVYGPRPDNSQFLREDAPLLASSTIRDLIDVDMRATSYNWKHPEMETVVLRPVHILGSVHNAPSNYLRLPVIPTVLGFDPMVQVIHEEDVVESMLAVLKPGARGVYNVTGPGEVPLSVLIKQLGKTQLPIPSPIYRPLLDFLWAGRMTSFPVPELDHIKYVCMVDGSRIRDEVGYRPKMSLADTIAAVR